MSTEAETQKGQPQPDLPVATGGRQEPQTLIRESIKYRRRAQEAERRAEALEAEFDGLRQAQQDREVALQAELSQARAEADALGARLADLERDRNLERELVKAGCADAETVLALARQRLIDGEPPENLSAFAEIAAPPEIRALLERCYDVLAGTLEPNHFRQIVQKDLEGRDFFVNFFW